MRIRAIVKPSAKREAVTKADDGILQVAVKEPPHEGRANRAAIKAVAGYFGIPASRVKIKSGLSSPRKVIEIT